MKLGAFVAFTMALASAATDPNPEIILAGNRDVGVNDVATKVPVLLNMPGTIDVVTGGVTVTVATNGTIIISWNFATANTTINETWSANYKVVNVSVSVPEDATPLQVSIRIPLLV